MNGKTHCLVPRKPNPVEDYPCLGFKLCFFPVAAVNYNPTSIAEF